MRQPDTVIVQTSALPKLSKASASVPVKRRTDDWAGNSGVNPADWSGAHRPTSARLLSKPWPSEKPENAGPP